MATSENDRLHIVYGADVIACAACTRSAVHQGPVHSYLKLSMYNSYYSQITMDIHALLTDWNTFFHVCSFLDYRCADEKEIVEQRGEVWDIG